ncbi:MAG TPA: OsmC family protein [Kofleriaceae bacterium]|jgi:putative redox protein|nr:OsmC family protein [Kofleriaceae bacterium]
MNTIDAQTLHPGEYPSTVRVRSHSFTSDVAAATGGQDSAPGPHDFFDTALATCKAMTAMWYAKRHGIPLERVESHVESDDSQERAGVYRIRVRVELFGPLTDEQRAQIHRAIAACPIHKLMTTSDVQIEVMPPAAG